MRRIALALQKLDQSQSQKAPAAMRVSDGCSGFAELTDKIMPASGSAKNHE
jgi:hypothetical protein